jgi:hypothetical protein
MALAGAIIVMSGLAVLSFVISQFPKAIAYLEKRQQRRKQLKEVPAPTSISGPPGGLPLDPQKLTDVYMPLAQQLGESFQLTELYRISSEHHLPHIHLSIRTLLETGLLLPKGEGIFAWKK